MKTNGLLRMNLQTFAAGQTGIGNLVNPQVMADMISAELPKAIKFMPILDDDATLKNRAGTELTVPRYGYIGPAVDVAEFGAIPIEQLASSTTKVTIKKAGKGVEISDEAVLSGLGDPVGEGKKQLRMSVSDKIDNDTLVEMKKATLTSGSATAGIDVALDDAIVAFNDESDETQVIYAFVSPKGYAALRRSEGFKRSTDLADQTIVSGRIGDYLGATVVISKKLNDGEAFVVKPKALVLLRKRDLEMEKDRDIVHKTTIVTVDQHFGVYLKDTTRIVKVTHKPLT